MAWCQIFDKYKVINNINIFGSFKISADQIKNYREPRLMTKFDHFYLLPSVFKENDITILPLTRGSYILGRFDVFHTLEKVPSSIKYINYSNPFETLYFDNITSETSAIYCAYVSKILEDFLGEVITPTVSGRMSSDRFQFQINTKASIIKNNVFNVDRAQIEIDAGFESAESFSLLEAKNHFIDDFIIRQMYYPFRKWRMAIKKKVRNLIMTYSNGVFELREYDFMCENDYNSINLIHCQRYAICNFQINTQLLQDMICKIQLESEPAGIPFPQADSFDRVINLCELLVNEAVLTKEEITEKYGFNERQTGYYTNACKYLGLLKDSKDEVGFTLTEEAGAIFKQNIKLRIKFLIETLLKKRVFKDSLELYLSKTSMPTNEELVQIMRVALPKENLSESTYGRRASTVRSWIDWIVMQIEE